MQQDADLQELNADLQRRKRYRPSPQKIADIMGGLLAKRGYAQEQAASEADEAWKAVLGGPLSEHTRAGKQRGSVLHVTVRNSAVLQELTFKKRQLLQRLTRQPIFGTVRDLRFRVGTVD